MSGRPRKEFDQNTFEKLLELQCTQAEICNFFNTTDKTISAWCKRTYKKDFSECLEKFGTKGRISLRRAQFKMAQNNPTMAIWLGKQFLGQKDYRDYKVTTEFDKSAQEIEAYLEGRESEGFAADN